MFCRAMVLVNQTEKVYIELPQCPYGKWHQRIQTKDNQWLYRRCSVSSCRAWKLLFYRYYMYYSNMNEWASRWCIPTYCDHWWYGTALQIDMLHVYMYKRFPVWLYCIWICRTNVWHNIKLSIMFWSARIACDTSRLANAPQLHSSYKHINFFFIFLLLLFSVVIERNE